VKDAVIGYLQVASGLTDVTRQRATATAKSLLGDGGLGGASDKVNVGQVQSLAEELVAASKANRELLTGLIRAEVDRAVGALGLATRDDVAALRRQVERQQHDMREMASTKKSATRKPTKKPAARSATKPAKKTTKRATKPASSGTTPSMAAAAPAPGSVTATPAPAAEPS